MGGAAAVLGGAAAVFGVGGGAAVFGVGGAAVFGVGGGGLRNLSAALSLRSVRRRSAAGVFASVQLFGRGAFAALVFFNSRPQNRGGVAAQGCCRACAVFAARRRFWAARRFLAAARRGGFGQRGGGFGQRGGGFGRRGGGFGRRGGFWCGRRGGFWRGRRLFAQPFGGALAPLGSPPCFVPDFAPCFAAVIPRADFAPNFYAGRAPELLIFL